eukprot:3261765-Alexandrium_andersonii.AAC.1
MPFGAERGLSVRKAAFSPKSRALHRKASKKVPLGSVGNQFGPEPSPLRPPDISRFGMRTK